MKKIKRFTLSDKHAESLTANEMKELLGGASTLAIYACVCYTNDGQINFGHIQQFSKELAEKAIISKGKICYGYDYAHCQFYSGLGGF